MMEGQSPANEPSRQAAPAITPAQLAARIARLREAAARPVAPQRAALGLMAAFERWRERGFAERRATVARLAGQFGWSAELLDESIDALIAPFGRAALAALAAQVVPRPLVGGFVMPANVPGAGLHELVAALISGAAAMVKVSPREPHFFPAFARTVRECDLELGAALEVVEFGRERNDLTTTLTRGCDFIVALGEDASIEAISRGARVFGFGSRASGALVSLAAPANVPALAAALARDVTLFEQQGCLSPHHVLVEDPNRNEARAFARALADALETLAAMLLPNKLSFADAAAIRRMRESARWRKLGGREVDLYEGAALRWTVVFDAAARFTVSPGFRSVTVSAVRDRDDFQARLAPIAGRLEAFALAVAPQDRAGWLQSLASAGVSYVCDPGRMQSPPILWPHGGGAFIDFLRGGK
jgi:acyl-CoA reductase-like NAD-dependent aldehyde dehydrogenase